MELSNYFLSLQKVPSVFICPSVAHIDSRETIHTHTFEISKTVLRKRFIERRKEKKGKQKRQIRYLKTRQTKFLDECFIAK